MTNQEGHQVVVLTLETLFRVALKYAEKNKGKYIAVEDLPNLFAYALEFEREELAKKAKVDPTKTE